MIINVITEIEKLILQILWNPDWVSDYIPEQLNNNNPERFNNFISPVLLLAFLIISAYGFLELKFADASIPLEISGPKIVNIGEKSTFFVQKPLFWSGDSPVAAEVWFIHDMTLGQTIYKLVRVKSEGNIWVCDNDIERLARCGREVDYDQLTNLLAIEGTNDNKPAVSVEVGLSELPSPFQGYKFEYTWDKAGYYSITVIFFSDRGETTSINPSRYGVTVLNETQNSMTPLPDSSLTNITDYRPIFESEDRALFIIVIALLMPLWIGFCEELIFRRQFPNQITFRQNLYSHSYYISPLIISILMFSFAAFYFFPSSKFSANRTWIQDTFSDNVMIVALFLVLAFFIWFFIVEVRYFYRKYRNSVMATFIITAVILYMPYLALSKLEIVTSKDFWVLFYVVLSLMYFLGILFIKAIPLVKKADINKKQKN